MVGGRGGDAISRDSRYFLAFAITGIRVAQLLGIPTKGRENFFIRERQLFSETKLNNKSPLQSLLFIIDSTVEGNLREFDRQGEFGQKGIYQPRPRLYTVAPPTTIRRDIER